MGIDRRQFIKVSAAATIVFGAGLRPKPAISAETTAESLIKEFTGGAPTSSDKLTLETPEIAENGNTVPISVQVDSAMTGNDFVETVLVVADGNPLPEVIRFNFTTMSGEAFAKTRIRLAKTQNVTAVAKMADGTFQMATNSVKVTIGGCGG